MTSQYIPPNGNPPPRGRRDIQFPIPGVVMAPPAIKTPKSVKFMDRVRVKLQRSQVLELQNSQWAEFYAGATGRVIRFNVEDGTLVVVLDTDQVLHQNDRIMECFEEHDLQRINSAGDAIDIDGTVIEQAPAVPTPDTWDNIEMPAADAPSTPSAPLELHDDEAPGALGLADVVADIRNGVQPPPGA